SWCPADQLDSTTGRCGACTSDPCTGLPTAPPTPAIPPTPTPEAACFRGPACNGTVFFTSRRSCCELSTADVPNSWCPTDQRDSSGACIACSGNPCEGLP